MLIRQACLLQPDLRICSQCFTVQDSCLFLPSTDTCPCRPDPISNLPQDETQPMVTEFTTEDAKHMKEVSGLGRKGCEDSDLHGQMTAHPTGA